MSAPDPKRLDSHHRDTLLQLFQHPVGHNIEWHDVLSLLEAVGSVETLDDGEFRVRLGDEDKVLARPSQKDIDAQQVVDLRRMLDSAGYGAVAAELEAKGKEA